MSNEEIPPLEEWEAERRQAQFAENAEILRELRAARAVARQKEAEVAEMRDRLGLYERLEDIRLEPPEWLAPDKPKRHVAIPCLGLGDLHWGERVNPETIGGVNAYDLEIAEARLERAFTGTITVARDYWAGLDYDGFQVFLTGDMISGTIHEELRETNEETLTETVISLVEPLAAGIELLAGEFERLSVLCVVGNHGRFTRKTRVKAPQENADWLIYQMVARDFRDRDDVHIEVATGFEGRATVYGTRYLLRHRAPSGGGTGIAGIMSPLLLGVHRLTKRAAAAGNPFDIMVCGHYHQSVFYPSRGIIVAGSPKGYDEYAAEKSFEPEPPQSTLWLTTPERGVTQYAPIFCADREAEGW